jgi:hypothetical protein
MGDDFEYGQPRLTGDGAPKGIGLRQRAVPRWSFNYGEEFTGVPCPS